LALVATSAWGQREWVDLQKAKARLDLAREELRRAEALAQEGLISPVEKDKRAAEVRLLELDYRDALWQFQGSRLRVIVADSVRTTAADGLDQITLILELPPLGVPAGESSLGDVPLGVADLQVSLVDKGVVIGYPYARVVPYLAPGQKVQVDFQLLRPVETPTVALEYRGRREEVTLYPRVTGAHAPFRLRVAQPSLTVVFGEEGRFVLLFEPLQPQAFTLDLLVRGLPTSCAVAFREKQSGATLSSLRLGAETGPREVELSVKLPPGPVGELSLDSPLVFSVVARWGSGGEVSQELRLTPVGIPKLELRAASWLVEGEAGGQIAVPLDLVNLGTAPAEGVSVSLELPGEFLGQLRPPLLPRVEVGQKERCVLLLQVAKQAAAGEYSLRLQPRASNRTTAQGEGEVQLRVRVRGSKPWLFPLGLALGLGVLGLVARGWVRKLRLD
jgi:hypothetical protein